MANPFGRRYVIELFLSVAIWLGIILSLPKPEPGVVNGHEVALVTLFGRVVPEWGLKVFFLGLFVIIYAAVTGVGHRMWPEKEEQDKSADHWASAPKASSRSKGKPWVATPAATAEEYLTGVDPWQIRGGYEGFDEEDEEDAAFYVMQVSWLEAAPETTLRDLLPAYTRLVQEADAETRARYLNRLKLAQHIRDIPTREEIARLKASEE